jgi:hypothetical protein
VLGVAMGSSFAAASRTSALAGLVSGKPVMLGSNVDLAAEVKALRYSGTSSRPDGRRLVWRPAALILTGSQVQVARAGDLVMINTKGRSTPLQVNLYITNGAALARSYSSFVLPIALWRSLDPTTRASWQRSATTYITDAGGKVSFDLPAGQFYDITLEQGGSLYPIPGQHALAPAFFAQG